MKHVIRNAKSCATFITLKCKIHSLVTLVDDYHGIMKDPFIASERALRRYQKNFNINYDPRLFTIAVSPEGHYLVYDNNQVLAYTVIRI